MTTERMCRIDRTLCHECRHAIRHEDVPCLPWYDARMTLFHIDWETRELFCTGFDAKEETPK